MKSRILVTVILVMTCNAVAQDLGGFFIGINHSSANKSNRYNIEPDGTCWGFFIPLNLDTKISIAFKFKSSFHSADHFSSYSKTKLKSYFNVTNEIQLGYPYQFSEKISLLPQIGFGAMGEAVHTNYWDGYTDADLFLDLSFISVFHFDAFGIGPMINYEMNLGDQRGQMLSAKRLLFSIVIMK